MAGTTTTPGDYTVTNPLDSIGAVVGAIVGKETNTTTNTTQNTTGNTSQNSSSTGNTTNNTTGTTSNTGSATGTTSNTGSVTGTTSNTGSVTGTTSNTGSVTGNTTNNGTSANTTTGNTSQTGTTTNNSTSTNVNSNISSGGSTNSSSGSFSQSQAGGGTNSSSTTGSSSSTGSTNTSGTTSTSGTSRTGGTVSTTNTGQTTNNSVSVTDADLSGLREIYAKQAKGMTPEMLAAIFTEGARSAPQLITSQSNAMGARGEGNTAVARVLNDLNSRLTEKAANLERELMRDASSTAAAIAANTHRVTTTGTQDSSSVSDQVQDLLTTNNTQSVMNQIANSINNSTNQSSTAGSSSNWSNSSGTNSQSGSSSNWSNSLGVSTNTTSGTSTTNQTGTNTQASNGTTTNTGTNSQTSTGTGTSSQNSTNNGTQNQNSTNTGTSSQNSTNNGTSSQNSTGTSSQTGSTTGTQSQTSTGNQTSNTATSINSNAASQLASAAAAGVGLATLYKMATGNGFTGTVTQFANWLKGTGTTIAPATQAEIDAAVLNGVPADDGTTGGIIDAGGIPDIPDDNILDITIPDTPDIVGDPGGLLDDIGGWLGFADGGQVGGFDVPDLFKEKPYKGNEDADLDAIMAALGFGAAGLSGALSNKSSSSKSSSKSGYTGVPDPSGFQQGSTDNGGVSTSNSGGISSNPSGVVDGLIGQAINTAISSMIGIPGLTTVASLMGLNIGKTAVTAFNNNATQNAIDAAVMSQTPADDGTTAGIQAAIDAMNADSSTSTDADADADADGTDGSDGDGSDGSDGDGWADGGKMESYDHELTEPPTEDDSEILNVFGISRGTERGELMFNTDAVKAIMHAIHGNPKAPGYADGGILKGATDLRGRRPEWGKRYADGGVLAAPKPLVLNPRQVQKPLVLNPQPAPQPLVLNPQPVVQPQPLVLNPQPVINTARQPLVLNPQPVTQPQVQTARQPLVRQPRIAGFTNQGGRHIRGPGTGISDSIPAVGPRGQPLRVANGEYIVPADVVQKVGPQALDALVDKHHVPADMQRAILGD